jgi:hypothetical protein
MEGKRYGQLSVNKVFPKKLVEICKIISKAAYAILKVGKETSCDFTLKKGLRKGDAIAPLLFNVALEIAVQHSETETSGTILVMLMI